MSNEVSTIAHIFKANNKEIVVSVLGAFSIFYAVKRSGRSLADDAGSHVKNFPVRLSPPDKDRLV